MAGVVHVSLLGSNMLPTVNDIETWLGQALPEPYRTFLANTPACFLSPNDRTLVYGREIIIEQNETYESKIYCPGNLMIGDDSGGMAIVLSLINGRISGVDQGAMTEDCFEPLATSFQEWEASEFRYQLDESS